MKFMGIIMVILAFIDWLKEHETSFKPFIFIVLCKNLDQEISKRQRGRRDHRNNRYNANQYHNTLSRRGDISVIHGDCDGKIFFSCLLLIEIFDTHYLNT